MTRRARPIVPLLLILAAIAAATSVGVCGRARWPVADAVVRVDDRRRGSAP